MCRLGRTSQSGLLVGQISGLPDPSWRARNRGLPVSPVRRSTRQAPQTLFGLEPMWRAAFQTRPEAMLSLTPKCDGRSQMTNRRISSLASIGRGAQARANVKATRAGINCPKGKLHVLRYADAPNL